ATVSGSPAIQSGLNCFLIVPTSPVPYNTGVEAGTGVYYEQWAFETDSGGAPYYAGYNTDFKFQSTSAATSLMNSIGQARVANKSYCLVGAPANFSSTYTYVGDPAALVPYVWNGSSWVNYNA